MSSKSITFRKGSSYIHIILGHPRLTLAVFGILFVFILCHIGQFRLDASSDTLLLENDESLNYYRAIKAAYGSNENLVITYSPRQELFSDEVIDDLKELHYQLSSIEQIESVTSLLNVPLLESPPLTLSDIAKEVITLEHPNAQRDLAQKEFLSSPLYRNLLISTDGRTTALLLQIKRNQTWQQLLAERDRLRRLSLERELTAEEKSSLTQAEKNFTLYKTSFQKQLDQDIKNVRSIMDQHRDMATLYLGGVPMIASDSVNFVRNDLLIFGVGVFFLLVMILLIIFNRIRWVFMAMSTCVIAGISVMGILGMINWPVTVVSSNFISLMLILTLSLIVHLIVRYRELLARHPRASQIDLIASTVNSKFIPSLYTVLTTMVAFGSLVVSNIRPIIDFGWMMVFGLTVSLVLTFTVFPAALALLKREKEATENTITLSITRFFARSNKKYGKWILGGFTVVALLSIAGILQLTVENRFIDYFKSSTEIYQGMEIIDRQLGGTTPMNIIIDAPSSFFEDDFPNDPDDEETFEDDLFDEDMAGDTGITGTSYWFNSYSLQSIAEIHDYLESLDETGKVLSLTTSMRMMEKLNPEILENNFALSLLYKQIPPKMKSLLIDPYLAPDGNQLRFSVRVYESNHSLRRQELMNKIRTHLTEKLGLEPEQVKITGILVLYNNLLRSLFQSQILTIGLVFVAILIMFSVLFRNIRLAIIAVIPNILSAGVVLGLMGWFKIPLDIMTITIAAICIGIAVDNTIHYAHRFIEEFSSNNDYWQSMNNCHNSIGRAIYYTTITIAFGFSILIFSNFIPTIYFGLLIGLSMIAALIANLTLFPLLLIYFKPLRLDNGGCSQ